MILYDEINGVGIRVYLGGWNKGPGYSLVDYYESEEVTYWKSAGCSISWFRI